MNVNGVQYGPRFRSRWAGGGEVELVVVGEKWSDRLGPHVTWHERRHDHAGHTASTTFLMVLPMSGPWISVTCCGEFGRGPHHTRRGIPGSAGRSAARLLSHSRSAAVLGHVLALPNAAAAAVATIARTSPQQCRLRAYVRGRLGAVDPSVEELVKRVIAHLTERRHVGRERRVLHDVRDHLEGSACVRQGASYIRMSHLNVTLECDAPSTAQLE